MQLRTRPKVPHDLCIHLYYQSWPDVDFFQYPPGQIFEFSKFWPPHKVSNISTFLKFMRLALYQLVRVTS